MPPPDPPDRSPRGFLTLADLLERWRGRLSRTELVVLSACESQRGKLAADEGMLALPWGFHFAGCASVVGSLWKVDDESTAKLMAAYYERLLAGDGRDKARALRAARRAIKKTHPDPYHWGAFLFLGDPQ